MNALQDEGVGPRGSPKGTVPFSLRRNWDSPRYAGISAIRMARWTAARDSTPCTTIAPPGTHRASICRIACSAIAASGPGPASCRRRRRPSNGSAGFDRPVEGPDCPAQALRLAERGRARSDHGRGLRSPLESQPPGMKHGRVMARAAGHVDHAFGFQTPRTGAIERSLMGSRFGQSIIAS